MTKNHRFYYVLTAVVLSITAVTLLISSAQAALMGPNDPILDVWYGPNQNFTQGTPQQWVNVLGNVTGTVSTINSLGYALNGVDQGALPLGPSDRRLGEYGDFNIQLDTATLIDGANEVVITATDNILPTPNQTVQTITVNYDSSAVWPLPYKIDWDTVTAITDAVQIVDGFWAHTNTGIRSTIPEYDRVVAIGDETWTDFDVTIPITVHSYDPDGFDFGINPQSYGAGLGLALRWTGHTNLPSASNTGCAMTHCGWAPQGATAWYAFTLAGAGAWDIHTFNMSNGNEIPMQTDPLGRTMTVGDMYYWRVRAQTFPTATLYAFNVWKDGQPEPNYWQMSGFLNPTQAQGSLLLITHHVDATFGDLWVRPLPLTHTLAATTNGNGSINNTPAGTIFTEKEQIVLTATAVSDSEFLHWSGDAIDGHAVTTYTINKNSNIIGNFSFMEGDGPGGVGLTDGSSSLELWLRADTGVFTDLGCSSNASDGASVACWQDQSGNGHQATGSTTEPIFDSVNNNIANQPSIGFVPASTDRLAINNFQLFNRDNSALTVFTVFDTNNNNSRGFLLNQGIGAQHNFELGYDIGLTGVGNFGVGKDNLRTTRGPSNTILNDTFAILSTNFSTVGVSPNQVQIWKDGSPVTPIDDHATWGGFLDAGQYVTASTTLDIGTRNQNGAGSYNSYHNGDIAEIIIYQSPLNSARRTIVENYLGAKYGIAVNTDIYASTTYTLGVVGIGAEADGKHSQSHSAGLILAEDGSSLATGEYVMAGHKVPTNGNFAADVPVPALARWTRAWRIEKTGTVDVSLTFDFSEGGMNGTVGAAGNYLLLYSPTNAFAWTVHTTGATAVSGDQITFNVANANLADGYYTLATADTAGSPLAVQLVEVDGRSAGNLFALIGLFALTLFTTIWVTQRKQTHRI